MFPRRLCQLVFLASFCLPALAGESAKAPCEPSSIVDEAKQLLTQKHYADASKKLDELQNCASLSPLQTFEMGWLYGRARRFDIALKIFQRVPPDVPNHLTHGYAVALSDFELANFHAAITLLESLRSAGVTDAKSANLLAVAYSKFGLFKPAYAVLNEQIGKDPNDLATYLNLITVCAEGGDFTRAADLASQAETHFPDSPDVLVIHGAASTLLGRSDLAVQDFSTVTRLAPDRADAWFFLALMHYNQANYPAAIAVLRQAHSVGLQDADLHYLMAECLLKSDAAQSAAALSELDRAVQLNPNSVAARTLRGRLLLDSGKANQAVSDLEVAHRADPGSRSTSYNLARAYRSLGKTESAAALFRQLRSEKPDTLKELGDRRLNQTLAQGAQP